MRRRTFLESAGSGTDSYVVVRANDWGISLKIADCTRIAILSFEPNEDRTKAQSMAKLRKLRAALNDIEAAIEEWTKK